MVVPLRAALLVRLLLAWMPWLISTLLNIFDRSFAERTKGKRTDKVLKSERSLNDGSWRILVDGWSIASLVLPSLIQHDRGYLAVTRTWFPMIATYSPLFPRSEYLASRKLKGFCRFLICWSKGILILVDQENSLFVVYSGFHLSQIGFLIWFL